MKWITPILMLIFGILLGWWMSPKAESELSASENQSKNVSIDAREKNHTSAPMTELSATESAVVEANGITQEWMTSLDAMEPLDQLSTLLDQMKTVESQDFSTLMTALQKYSGGMRWTAQSILATKWAESDPESMRSYIEAQPIDQQRSLRNLLYSAWAKEAPMAAFSAVLQMADRREQQSAMQSVIQAVAEENPQQAIQMAEEMRDLGHQSDWLMRNIYQRWSNNAPAAARASALAMKDGPEKVQALSGALQNWIQEDPIAALDWLESQPMDGTIYNSRKQVFSNLLNRDFETAKTFIASKTDPMERREVLESISLSNLGWSKGYEEIVEIYDWIGEVATGQVYDRKVGDVIRSLVQADPDRAEAFVLNLPAGKARMNALSNYARELANRDPTSAIEFALSMDYSDEKERVLRGMSWQLTRYGTENIRDIVASAEDTEVQRQLASRIVSEWSKYDQAGALTWAESLGDDQARRQALQKVYSNWMQAAPNEALAYLQTSVAEEQQGNYLRSSFREWSRQDPEQAISWLTQLPDSINENESAELYASVARNYVQHDPMAASEWIATLDDGDERDKSVSALVQNISKNDPEAGFIWATTVNNPNTRKNDLSRSVHEWVKVDPSAALAAVKNAQIGAEEKESLLKMIQAAQSK
jgi:hypothetical protein